MSPRINKKQSIVWEDNMSQPVLVADFANITVTAVGSGVVTIHATADIDVVDFSEPSTLDNSHAEISIIDTALNSSMIVKNLSVSNETKIGETNTTGLSWVCLERSSGTVDAFITLFDNQ